MKWFKRRSIAFTLTGWFLALSSVSVGIVSWLAFQNAVSSLERMEYSKLEDSSEMNVRVIKDWFSEIQRDLTNWSQRPATKEYYDVLREQWTAQGSSLSEYVKSDEYKKLEPEKRHQLERLQQDYDFVYDLFLIDLNGNILFNLTHERDLGTNLLQGEYSTTLFAKSFRQTIEDQQIHFSDIERYEPSNNTLAGFITLPLKSQAGQMIGVLAVQIRLDTIFAQFEASNREGNKIINYLVGSDGLLRSKINNENEVLHRRISTRQFWKWYKEHSLFRAKKNQKCDDHPFYYTGPDGERVLGQHHPMEVFGVRWVHISEMSEESIQKPIISLAQKTVLLVMANFAVIVFISFWIARRFSRPIIKLKELSDAYANGERDIDFSIDNKDEIGDLARAFQLMIKAQFENEQELKHHAYQAHKALKQLKEQKFALDAHAIVATTDVEGTILYVNEKLIDISGYSREELLGANHRLLNSGYHPKTFWQEMYKRVSVGELWHGEVCNRAKSGRLYWVDTTIVPFMGEDGKPESYIAIRTDITERIQNHEGLSNALQLQKEIFDKAGVSIIITDEKGVITQMNKAAEEMLGYDASEMVNTMTPEVIHKASEIVDRAKQFGEELQIDLQPGFDVFVIKAHFNLPNAHEWTYIRKDGSEIPVFLSVSALRHSDGTIYGYMGLATDIGVFKEAEVQMMRAKRAAEDSARAKSEFLAAMSHEIRTPMNGVIGMLGLLSKSRLDESQHHQVQVAQSSAHSLLGLINDILDFSKVEAGKMNLEYRPLNLREELGDFAESIAFKAQEKGVEFILDMTELPELTILSDSGRIRQILTNLAGNAIKFTHSGEVMVKVSIQSENPERGKLIFEVSDTGIGIAQEKIDTLFEAFSQADSSTTRKYGGTGLGLAIVKKLCEMMGGSISARSVLRQGSTFTAQIEVEIKSVGQMDLPHVRGSHLLVIDDNRTVSEIIEKSLSSLGAKVDTALNAFDGIDRCMAQAALSCVYDMILIDMNLEDINGLRTAEEILKLPGFGSSKLVLMTPIGEQINSAELKAKGFCGSFTKPMIDRDMHYLDQLIEGKVQIDKSESIQEKHEYQWPEGTRLLLVEDNPTNQMVAQGMLNMVGLEPEIANNGLEALELLSLSEGQDPYSLILMDCQMPEMDGYETTRLIRSGEFGEGYAKIPIVALTANAMSGDREQCIAAGMDDYLAKPIDPDALTNMLLKWLKGTQTVQKDFKNTPVQRVETNQSIWDKEEAIKRIGGKKEFLSKILHAVNQDTPLLLKAIEEAIEEKNLASIQLNAHSIKGSAGNVSAHKLQFIAKQIESDAKEGNLGAVVNRFGELQDAIAEVMVQWREYLENDSRQSVKKTKKKIDPLVLAIELQSLKTKLNGGDYIDTSVLPIFEDDFGEPIGSLIFNLKEMINQFQYDNALRVIDTIMDELE